MEYKIFFWLRQYLKIPFIIRVILSLLSFIFWIFLIILPFPGSFMPWLFLIIVGVIFLSSANKLRHIIKMRRSIFYLCSNIHKNHIIKHKIYDIKKHIIKILKKDKIKIWLLK